MATEEMRDRLPELDDDSDIGIEKDHVVPNDGNPDISFRGVLLASAAPECWNKDRWREYRVYRTLSRNYVFSKIGRSILEGERDKFEAAVWEPSFAAKPGQFQTEVLTMPYPTAERQLADALTAFFKYDALAKQLYADLKIDTSRRID